MASLNHRDGSLVGVVCRRDSNWIAAVGQIVGIEAFVAVRTVLAGDGDAVDLFATLIKRDGRVRPERRQLGRAPAEEVVASRGNHHAAKLPSVLIKAPHIRAIRTLRVLVEISTRAEARADGACLSLSGVVVEHGDHGDFLGSGAGARSTRFVAVVATFISHVIAVGPAPLLQTAGKVVVQLQNVGNAWVGELTEKLRVGMARESTAGLTEGCGLVVTVGVDQAHALAGHVEGVLPLFLGGEIAIMAIGVGDTKAGGETARAGGV